MKILFSGSLGFGQTSRARKEALEDVGHEVVPIGTERFFNALPRIVRGLESRLLVGPAAWCYNRAILKLARHHRPEVIWIETGLFVWPSTLRALRRNSRAILVHYNTDDIMCRRHRFRLLLKSVPLYDLQITTNTYNLDDLLRFGAQRVALSELRYDSRIFYPRQYRDRDLDGFRSDVVFIGHWEETTEQVIRKIIEAGIDVKVWGNNWSRALDRAALRGHVMFQSIWGEDYVRALHGAKVALCFLSKWNRNTTAGRSFEIPATGTFLLAERTEDHLRSYREGIEAEFFSDTDELIAKIQHYVSHDAERAAIARRGYERCLRSGYSYAAQMLRDWKRVEPLLETIHGVAS